MANKTTTTRDMKANFVYTDNDTRLITIPNAGTYSSSQAATVRNALNTFGAITIGDKTGAAFSSVQTAYIEEKTTTKLDLSQKRATYRQVLSK